MSTTFAHRADTSTGDGGTPAPSCCLLADLLDLARRCEDEAEVEPERFARDTLIEVARSVREVIAGRYERDRELDQTSIALQAGYEDALALDERSEEAGSPGAYGVATPVGVARRHA